MKASGLARWNFSPVKPCSALAHSPAPINQIRQLELDDPSFLEKIFWQMIFLGLEWFPSERWFIEAGLENAASHS